MHSLYILSIRILSETRRSSASKPIAQGNYCNEKSFEIRERKTFRAVQIEALFSHHQACFCFGCELFNFRFLHENWRALGDQFEFLNSSYSIGRSLNGIKRNPAEMNRSLQSIHLVRKLINFHPTRTVYDGHLIYLKGKDTIQ